MNDKLSVGPFVHNWLPWMLRGRRLVALFTALLWPLNDLNRRFRARTDDMLRRVALRGQVMVLADKLNEEFDLAFRQIQIVDTPNQPGQFTVRVPSRIPLQGGIRDRMTAIVESYRISGTTYILQPYSL
jgi:hypothetical protein